MPRDLFAEQEERKKSEPKDLFAERGISITPEAPAEPEGSDLVRGFTSYGPQLKETFGGAKVLVGKALGSEALMKSGIESMEEAKQALRAKSKPTDSFSEALNKGIGTVLTDWLPYQMGSGAANLLESVAVMGAGAAVGSAVAPGAGTLGGGVFGLVEKELVKKGVKEAAEKILKESGEEVAKKFVEQKTAEAAKKVARDVAATSALAAQAGFHGAGETTSRAVEEAQRLGKEATDIEMGRVVPAAIVHGVAEFIGDKIGLGAFNKLDLNQKNLLLNFGKNLVVTGTKEAPVEAIQTAAERFGAELSLTDAEAIKEYVDSAAAAYAMSVVPAAGGAVKTRGMAGVEERNKELEAQFRQDIQQQEQETAAATQKAQTAAEDITKVGVPDEQGNVAPLKPISFDVMAPNEIAAAEAEAAATAAVQDKDVTAVIPEQTAPVPTAPIPKKENETPEEQIARYESELAVGKTANDKKVTGKYKENIENKLAELKEKSNVEQPPATINAAADQSSIISAPPAMGGTPTRTEAPDLSRVVDTGGDVATDNVAERAQPVALTEDQVKVHYDNLIGEVASAHNMQLPAWEELSPAEKEAITKEAVEAQITKGMTPSKGEQKVSFITPAIAAIYKSRMDAARKEETKEVDQTPTWVVEGYEDARKGWETENELAKETVQWDDLNADDRAIVNNIVKNGTQEEFDNALDTLHEYRKSKPESGASYYEINRQIYNRELPRWEDLNPDEKKAFLTELKPGGDFARKGQQRQRVVSTEQVDAGFKAVVEKVNARLKEKAEVETKQEQEQKGKAQRVAKEEEAAAKEEVEVGKELPVLVKIMLGEGGVNNVLAYIAKKAGGIRIGKKDSPRSEAIRNYEKRYGALSRAIFKNIASTLNTINFSKSKVVIDPKNKVIQQLQKENKLAAYDPKTDTFYFTKYGMDEMTVLHEIVHAGTIKILYAYKNNPSSLTQEQRAAAEQINKVYEFAKGKLSGKYPNQMENVYEFVSYALTDPRFQEELSRIQAPSLAKYTLAPKPATAEMQSIWSHFTKVLMKLYGLTKAAARFFEIKPDLYDDVAKAFGGEKYTKQKLEIDKTAQREVNNYIAKEGDVDTSARLTFESVSGLRDTVASRLEDNYPEAFSNTSDQGVADFVETYLNNRTFAEEVDKTAADTYKQAKIGLTKQAGFEGNALLEVTQAFQGILAAPEAGIDIEALPAKKPKAAPTTDRSIEELESEMKTGKQPAAPSKVWSAVLSGKTGPWLEKKFANDRAPIKRWQRQLANAGRVIAYGVGMNNIYDQIVLSSGNAHYMYTQYVQAGTESLRQEIAAYADKNKLSVEEALQKLALYSIARHLPERREVLYMRNVDLSSSPIIKFTNAQGQASNISPAQMRDEIFKELDTNKNLTEAEIKYFNKTLRSIAFDKNQTFLDSKVKGKDLANINSSKYNVAGAFSDAEVKTMMDAYNANKAEVQPIFDVVDKLNKTTLKLNKMSNYMSPYANNWIKFYGWENYVPLKGRHLSDDTDMLNFDSRRLGGELQEKVHTFEGNQEIPDNPVLQVMADAALASMRVGRKNITEAIYNSSKKSKNNPNGSGLLPTAEVMKVVDFEDRRDQKFLDSLGGETKIFHYMPDGKVAVISIKDKTLLEAIRRSYREINPFIDFLNKATGVVGQFHTRFNIAFAPINFARDVLTNAFTIGADMGPLKAFNYLGSVAKDVVTGKLWKTVRFNYLYSKGEVGAIRTLAAKDQYYKDLFDLTKTGGRVSWLAGIANKGQFNELNKEVGTAGILSPKQAIKFFDGYIEAFEMASRVAAFRIAKETELAELKRQNITGVEAEKTANTKAASYTKELANFEQSGEWGKTMGAWFMFFRPSATGAVRAIDAVAPAIMNAEQARMRQPQFAEAAVLRDKLKDKSITGITRTKMEAKLKDAEKAIQNFDEKFAKNKQNAQVMVACLIGMGYLTYQMAHAMADDDDNKDELGRNKIATDDMSRWTKFARFYIPGVERPLQIPWGFGLGAFAAMGAQIGAMFNGNIKPGESLSNMVPIVLDSFLPLPVSRIPVGEKPLEYAIDSALPSIIRPFVEYAMNVDALGRQIYNNRQSRFGEAYTGGDNIPELYKSAARWWFDTTGNDVSPNSLYFFANSYADGASRVMHNGTNISLWLAGKKDFDPKTDTIFFDSFVGSKSNYDARQWQRIEDDLKEREQKINMLKNNKPDQYLAYLSKNPLDEMLANMYNHDVNGHLKDLREQANKYRAMDYLSPKERKDIVDAIVLQQNFEKYRLVQMYKAFGVKP